MGRELWVGEGEEGEVAGGDGGGGEAAGDFVVEELLAVAGE